MAGMQGVVGEHLANIDVAVFVPNAAVTYTGSYEYLTYDEVEMAMNI